MTTHYRSGIVTRPKVRQRVTLSVSKSTRVGLFANLYPANKKTRDRNMNNKRLLSCSDLSSLKCFRVEVVGSLSDND